MQGSSPDPTPEKGSKKVNEYKFNSDPQKNQEIKRFTEDLIKELFRHLYDDHAPFALLAQRDTDDITCRWDCPRCQKPHDITLEDDPIVGQINDAFNYKSKKLKSNLEGLIENKTKEKCPFLKPKGKIGF